MSPEPRIFFRKSISESGTKYLTARIVDHDGTVTVQSDYGGTVNLKIYDLSGSEPETEITNLTRTVASTVFNSLQTWDEDAIGFNFQDDVTSNELGDYLNGDHTLRFCYRLNHTSDGVQTVIFEARVLPHLGT